MSERLMGIVPAGGRGTRLAPYPGPKELFPVGWQPYQVNGEVHRRPKVVSQYVLESMAQAGVRHVLMIVGEHKYDLLRYYASGERVGLHLSYLYQDEPLGMMHAIDLAYPWTQGARMAFGMPDTITHPPDVFERLLDAHRRSSADLTLGLFETTRPWKFGMVEMDESGRIVAHVDKPRTTTLTHMWGIAAWEPSFTELIHEINGHPVEGRRREPVLGDAIDEAIARGYRVQGHAFPDGFYVDIGTYDEIVEAQAKITEVLR
ncbi:MAG TPA: nucleotidyltransferase family protein [bacterium]|nr:nucleotidyltransferase family protein [bacterium]